MKIELIDKDGRLVDLYIILAQAQNITVTNVSEKATVLSKRPGSSLKMFPLLELCWYNYCHFVSI